MVQVELLIAALALVCIGVGLGLSAVGLIEIPDALYQGLTTIALAAIGTRGGRMVQTRALKKKYKSDIHRFPGDGDEFGDDDPEDRDPP